MPGFITLKAADDKLNGLIQFNWFVKQTQLLIKIGFEVCIPSLSSPNQCAKALGTVWEDRIWEEQAKMLCLLQ